MYERWVWDWINCNILTASFFVFSSTSFSFCLAAQSGVLRAHSPLLSAGSLYSILSPTNWLQLTEPACGTGLYNCLTPTCFLWATHLHPIQPVHIQGYTLISSTGRTCSSIDGCVEGQYFTLTNDPYGQVINLDKFKLNINVSELLKKYLNAFPCQLYFKNHTLENDRKSFFQKIEQRAHVGRLHTKHFRFNQRNKRLTQYHATFKIAVKKDIKKNAKRKKDLQTKNDSVVWSYATTIHIYIQYTYWRKE